MTISTYWLGPTSPTGSGGIGMPPRMGMLAVAGMPSKFTVGAAIFGATLALVLAAWTAASPLNPWPAGAGPRSGRFRAVGLRLAVTGRLATSRIDGDTSKPAAAVTFGVELAAAAAGGRGRPGPCRPVPRRPDR